MIGIYGDSFADTNPRELHDREKEIWPWAYWLGESCKDKIECHAVSATSLWFSFTKFLNTYRNYDKIVFCYTNYMRWNTLADEYISLSHVRDPNDVPYLMPNFQETGSFLVEAYPILYRDDLNRFIYQHVFNEVNRLCKKYKIKLVNLLPFENSTFYFPKGIGQMIDFSLNTGPCLTGLMEVSTKEINDSERLLERLKHKNDLRHCHINSYNNRILSSIIFENMHTTNIKNVSLDSRFKFDERFLVHAFDNDD